MTQQIVFLDLKAISKGEGKTVMNGVRPCWIGDLVPSCSKAEEMDVVVALSASTQALPDLAASWSEWP